jgi:hypothetical protein
VRRLERAHRHSCSAGGPVFPRRAARGDDEIQQPRDACVDVLSVGVDDQVRLRRLLVRRVDAGEILELPRTRLPVVALRVAPLGFTSTVAISIARA